MTIRNLILLLIASLLLAGCGDDRPRLTGDAEPLLPAFAFADLEGKSRSSAEWEGKVLLINFWATWCPPCRREMPLLIEYQGNHGNRGLQVVAIAIDDPSLVQDFADVYGINFPVLIGDAEAMRLANRMGNRFDALPYTAVYGGDGRVRYLQAGELTRDILDEAVIPLL